MFTSYKAGKTGKDSSSFREAKRLLTSNITASLESQEFLETLQREGFSEAEYRVIAMHLKAAMLQTLSVSLNLEAERISSQLPGHSDVTESPVAQKLHEKNGFSLLLLTVESFDDSGSRKFIVGFTNEKAEQILSKAQLTVIDYERDDIVRAFGEKEEVTSQAIQSAIKHFEEHFVKNAEMKRDFSPF